MSLTTMFTEKAAMFVPVIKRKLVVVCFYIGLIVTYDLAAPALAWKQSWTPNSVVGNEGESYFHQENMTMQKSMHSYTPIL